MRSTVLAHLMLCCAAVLFLPQALECCRHTGSHTVLEALADGDARATRPSHGGHQKHAEAERRERVNERVTARASGQEPGDSTESRQIMKRSLPGGPNTSQPPSLAAFILKALVSLDTGFRLATAPHSEGMLYGQTDRPETPPPRRLV